MSPRAGGPWERGRYSMAEQSVRHRSQRTTYISADDAASNPLLNGTYAIGQVREIGYRVGSPEMCGRSGVIAPTVRAASRFDTDCRSSVSCGGISPYWLRHSFITAALDAAVPLRDVQEAASHSDPRTTMRYDRRRRSLDRHTTHVVSTFVAGATTSGSGVRAVHRQRSRLGPSTCSTIALGLERERGPRR